MIYQSPVYPNIQHEYNADCSMWRPIVDNEPKDWRVEKENEPQIVDKYVENHWTRVDN